MEAGGTVTFCVCYIQGDQKIFFFLLQRKFYVVFNCNILFPYPKETWCLERLLIFMKNTF